jgi:hypothetical protein
MPNDPARSLLADRRRAWRGAALAALIALGAWPAAQAQSWFTEITGWGGERVKGSGKIVTDKRAIAGYEAVSVKGPQRVVLRQSGNEGVEVTADDNIVPLIETRLDGKTLEIAMKRGYSVSTRSEIIVTVDVKRLTAVALSGSGDVLSQALQTSSLDVSISGSGDVALNNLTADSLKVAIAGSGDFTATGNVPTQRYSISGSGDVRSIKLQGRDVTVKIAGSGDAQVWATGTLTASIAGSGDVVYVGEAKVTSSIAGSGSVAKK